MSFVGFADGNALLLYDVKTGAIQRLRRLRPIEFISALAIDQKGAGIAAIAERPQDAAQPEVTLALIVPQLPEREWLGHLLSPA